MLIKEERGVTAIDIAVSVIILTIFIALIGNLILNININSESLKRKAIATSYAVKEIEKIKAKGYIEEYNDLGINEETILQGSDVDIFDNDNVFTGFHKTTFVKDYVLIQNDYTKQRNLVKELTVEIHYKVYNKQHSVKISTFVTND